LKLLVVDDEANVRRLLAATLERRNISVLQANTGEEALELAARELPDVVLLDVAMPGIGGIETCRRLKKNPRLQKSRVVVLTARAQDSVRREAIAAGADLFLTKPFSPLQLLELIGRRGPSRDLQLAGAR
jgi:CheY-like chemotaxis protein